MKTFFDCILLIILAFLCWPIVLLFLGLLLVFLVVLIAFIVALSPIWIPITCIIAVLD